MPDYPTDHLDIKLLVEGDDIDTIAAALAVSGAAHIEVVVIPACTPRTKPKALNVGLSRARGEFVVVYDAEDRPHPQQLRAALAAFEDDDASLACVQAPLAIDNADASWIARQFAAEYAIQFREILPFLASIGAPLPLGGTSNHFRTEVLREVGAWDPYNVSEDRVIFTNKLNRFRKRASHIPFVSHSISGAQEGCRGRERVHVSVDNRRRVTARQRAIVVCDEQVAVENSRRPRATGSNALQSGLKTDKFNRPLFADRRHSSHRADHRAFVFVGGAGMCPAPPPARTGSSKS